MVMKIALVKGMMRQTMPSIPPPADVSLEECAKYVLDRHPDQVDLHRKGKGCTGFLLGQVINMKGDVKDNSGLKAAHLAVRHELDKRLKVA